MQMKIVEAVKKHCRDVEVRVMTADVVHNHFCDDVVVVKISVPESRVSLAMEFDTWPDDIECCQMGTVTKQEI